MWRGRIFCTGVIYLVFRFLHAFFILYAGSSTHLHLQWLFVYGIHIA